MANNLFKSSAQTADWAHLYCNDLDTDALSVAGTLDATTVLATGNIDAQGGVSANYLTLDEDDVTATWAAAGNQNVPITSLKTRLDIDIAGQDPAAAETFRVDLQNANITTNHKVILSPIYSSNYLLDIEILHLLANLNCETVCVAGEAQLFFKNVSAGTLNNPTGNFQAGALLSFNVLIC